MMLIPSTLERIRRHLVGLRVPRALEALDSTVRQLECGEISALEALEALLGEELTLREGRRIKAALKMGRLINIKTLAQLDFIARHEVLHFLGQPGCGKTHLALALGVEAVKGGHSVYFIDPGRPHHLPRQGGARGKSARTPALPLPATAAHRR